MYSMRTEKVIIKGVKLGRKSYLAVQKETGAIGFSAEKKKKSFSFGDSLLSMVIRGASQNSR